MYASIWLNRIAVTMVVASMGNASAFAADEAPALQPAQSLYPVSRGDRPVSPRAAHVDTSRYLFSMHVTFAPIYKAVVLVPEYEPPEFLEWFVTGFRVDDLYRFGVVRIGAGLRYTACHCRTAFGLQELAIPFLFSAMGRLDSGTEIGAILGVGPDMSIFFTTGSDDAPKDKWLLLPAAHTEALFATNIPITAGLDFSFRAGVSLAVGRVFRLSVPIEIGIQRRW